VIFPTIPQAAFEFLAGSEQYLLPTQWNRSEVKSKEKDLFTAVLTQAFYDVLAFKTFWDQRLVETPYGSEFPSLRNGRAKKTGKRRMGRLRWPSYFWCLEAVEWFRSSSTIVNSFEFVCQHLNLDARWIRRELKLRGLLPEIPTAFLRQIFRLNHDHWYCRARVWKDGAIWTDVDHAIPPVVTPRWMRPVSVHRLAIQARLRKKGHNHVSYMRRQKKQEARQRYIAKWKARDPEGYREYKRISLASYRAKYPGREEARRNSWRLRNAEKLSASRARYRKQLKERTQKWDALDPSGRKVMRKELGTLRSPDHFRRASVERVRRWREKNPERWAVIKAQQRLNQKLRREEAKRAKQVSCEAPAP